MQSLNLEIEKIRDISSYDPDGQKNWAALKDDVRIAMAWYAAFLDPRRTIKFTEKEIIAVAVKIYKEIARVKKLDPKRFEYTVNPDTMKPAAARLWEKVKDELSQEEIEILLRKKTEKEKDEGSEGKSEAGEEYAEVKPSGEAKGREITIEEVLEKFNSFLLRKPFIYLVGGLAIHGKTKGDIDILIKGEPELPESFKIPLEFRIYRLFESEDRERIQFHYDEFVGPFTDFYELADLKVESREKFAKVEMSRDLEMDESEDVRIFDEIEKSLNEGELPEEFEQKVRYFLEVRKAEFRLAGKAGVEANREARASMREDAVVIGRRFWPLKTAVSGLHAYRIAEVYSISQSLAYLSKLYESGIR